MQVNTRATYDAATARMANLSSQLDAVNAQISTGKRIISADDDPIGAARVTQLHRALDRDTTTQRAVDSASSRLSATDTALDGASTLLVRAKEIALQAGDVGLNAADRATLAAETKQLADQLLAIANRTDSDGGTLFGGARHTPPAYAADPVTGIVSWQGAGSAPALGLDQTVVATGVEGPAAFAGLAGASGTTDAFALLTGLQAALNEPDGTARAAALADTETGLDSAIDRVADTRANIGARMARLDTETARISASNLQLNSDLESTEGLDMSTAIARLQRLSTVLSATQSSFVKIAGLSMWDNIR
jgi:flagellar hook-associated protein 3 FlgL